MNIDIRDGKQVSTLFYYVETLLLIILSVFNSRISIVVQAALVLYGIGSAVLFVLLSGKIMDKLPVQCRCLQAFLFILETVFSCYLIGNLRLMFCTFFLQQICFLFYMDKTVIKLQTIEILLTVFFLFMIDYLNSASSYNILECLNFMICIIGAEWILVKIIGVLIYRSKQNYEQERSLDDLLKVVEAKCDEARLATKTKSNFLSNMSHEIRTPINAILGMNEMILRESATENVMEYASNIESSGRMLLTLVNDILDFSKIESGKMELIPIEYQLKSIINDCVNMAKSRIIKKGLSFQVEVNPKIPSGLLGDELRIKQILTNLLSNAIKYTDKGSITLSVDYIPQDIHSIQLCFSVTDTGKGIRPEDKDKLFETFQRIDEKQNRSIEGTGLGLPITKSFVDMMQGTMTVDSTYGVGSVFHVDIPQKIMDTHPIGDIQNTFEKKSFSREQYQERFQAPDAKVLVVDDNTMNLAVVQQLLKRTKIQITLASSGKECLELTGHEYFDVILLDHMMPELDGMETLATLHQDTNNLCLSTPVIALTANAISGVRKMYLDAGFQDYLSKPITGKILEEMLLSYLPKDKIILKNTDGQSLQHKDSLNKTAPVTHSQIDIALGLSYCGNKESIYRDILQLFCNMKKDQIAFLDYAIKNEDWERYTAQLYELKSNTLNIGASNLSEFVKFLEYSGRAILANESSDSHISLLQNNHPKLIQRLEEVTAEGLQILDTYS